MRDSGIDLIDVGAGAGSGLYATADFYNMISQYAEFKGIPALKTPPPILHSVESSDSMVHAMHMISELAGRSGPFQRTVADFAGLNFQRRRTEERDAAIRGLESDNFTVEWTIDHLGSWKDRWRYNFGIFSYFLTQESDVVRLRAKLVELFRSMRAGGVVVLLGGTTTKYKRIYKAVESIAKSELMRQVHTVPTRIVWNYSDRYAGRIKTVYRNVWKHLEPRVENLYSVKAALTDARDLWDDSLSFRGPKAFSMQVFRRVNMRPGYHSWYKRKYRSH